MRSVLGHLGTTETSLAKSYGWHPTSSAGIRPSHRMAEGGVDPTDDGGWLSAGNRWFKSLRPPPLALEIRRPAVALQNSPFSGPGTGAPPPQTPGAACLRDTASGLGTHCLAQSAWACPRRLVRTAAPSPGLWRNRIALAPTVDPWAPSPEIVHTGASGGSGRGSVENPS